VKFTKCVTTVLCGCTYLLWGCARFTTTQTDTRENAKTGEKTTIVTKAASTTFFDSKSALTAFKASQTDKTQGASVGSLNQESSGTNAAHLIEGVVGAAVSSAVKAVAPVPK
jgi:hypothetical protein